LRHANSRRTIESGFAGRVHDAIARAYGAAAKIRRAFLYLRLWTMPGAVAHGSFGRDAMGAAGRAADDRGVRECAIRISSGAGAAARAAGTCHGIAWRASDGRADALVPGEIADLAGAVANEVTTVAADAMLAEALRAVGAI
jgi:hypothetical protein